MSPKGFQLSGVYRHNSHLWKRLLVNGVLIALSIMLPQMAVMPIHSRSEEHTSELQSHLNLVCRLLLEKKKHCEVNGQAIALARALKIDHCHLRHNAVSINCPTLQRATPSSQHNDLCLYTSPP